MGQLIFNAFTYFSGSPVNFWPWLLIILIPVLVFSATPNTVFKIRIGRLAIAVVCGYLMINLALHTSRALEWKAYEKCQRNSTFRIDSLEMYEECKHHINIADGASNIFYLILGWLPVAAYVGFWELVWRWRYRKEIKAAEGKFKGKWASTALIILSVPVWLYVIIVIEMYLAWITCPWFHAANRCSVANHGLQQQ